LTTEIVPDGEVEIEDAEIEEITPESPLTLGEGIHGVS
jgi:hypothetical protein